MCALSSQAAIDIALRLADYGTYAYGNGVTLKYNGNNLVSGSAIGVYRFDQDLTSPATSPYTDEGDLYSICLSPGNFVNTEWHTYDSLTFQVANPGNTPNPWAFDNNATPANKADDKVYGIQNAAYLYSLFANYGALNPLGVIGSTGTSSDKKARGLGLALAMYTALYDSSTYGTIGNLGLFTYQLNGDAISTAALSYRSQYLAVLDGSLGVKNKIATAIASGTLLGDVLKEDPESQYQADQEFLLLRTYPPTPPVPEPSTIIAGCLLLLPFGASILRRRMSK
jgi:hypothetical protein